MASGDDRVEEMLGGRAAPAPARGLRAGDAAVEQMLQPSDTTPIGSDDSAFRRGLRSGSTAFGGTMNALAGQVGELVGANDFAASQRAKSVAAQAQAGRESEGNIQSFRDVRGLRDTFNYVSNLAGASIPTVGAGIIGGAIGARTGTLGALTGATVATAPTMIGAEFEKQQADPVQAAQPLAERTLTGVGSGTGQAVVSNLIPATMGGKLLGPAAHTAMPAGKAIALNLSEGVLGEAAGGYAAPMIGQAAASKLNPNRDTSGDEAERLEGAVGGALLGVPFGAAGAYADTRGAKPVRTDGVQVGAPAEPGLIDKAKDFLKSKKDRSPVNMDELLGTLKPASSTAEHFARDAGILDMPPEAQGEALAAADQSAATKSQETHAALRQRPDLTPEEAQLLDGMDFNDPSAQAQVRDLATNYKMKDRQAARAASLDEAMKAAPDVGDDVKRSEDRVREPAVYDETLAEPEWDYLGEQAKDAVKRNLPRFTLLAENGKATPEMLRALGDTLGDKATDFLTKIYGDANKADPAKRDAYFKAVADMAGSAKEERSLHDVVRRSIPEELADRVDEDQIAQFVQGMKDFTNEAGTRGMTANEERVYKLQTDEKMRGIFGDKMGDVNEAFAKWATDQAEAGRGVEAEPDAAAAALEERAPSTHFFDTKGEVTHAIDKDGVFKFDREPSFVEHRDVAMDKYGTRAEDTAHARAERKVLDTDAEPGWTRAEDFAKEIGMPRERLMELTGGKPENFGLVSAKRMAAGDEFGDADIARMKFDTTRTTKQDGERNMARLDTTLPDGKKGPILDGFKIVSAMQKKVDYSGEGKGGLERTMRMFEEGIAAVQDKLGVKFNEAELRAVEVTKGANGKNLTYGDLLNGRDEALHPSDRTEIKMLRKQLDALGDAPEKGAERLQVKQAIARLQDNVGLPEKAVTELDGLRAKDDTARAALAKADAEGNALEAARLRNERQALNKEMIDLKDKYAEGPDGRFTDEMTTSAREKRVGEMELEVEKAEKRITQLEALAKTKRLDRTEWSELQSAKFKAKNFPDIIETQTKFLAEVKETANFAEAKGLGAEYGTGRDIGAGLDVNKQTRVADGKVVEGVREKEARSKVLEDIRDLAGAGDWAAAQKALSGKLTILRTNGEKAKGDELLIARDQFKRMREALKAVSNKDVAALDVMRAALGDEILDLKGSAKEPNLSGGMGVSEVDPSGQIHLAAAEHGEKGALVKRVGEDGANLEQYDRKKPAGPHNAAAELANKVRAMGKEASTVPAKTVAARAQDLINRYDTLPKGEQKQLYDALMTSKKVSDVADTVNRLAERFPARAQDTDARSQAVRDRDWAKDIADGGGYNREGKISGTPEDVQAGVVKLLRQKYPNDATRAYIAKANEQISAALADRANVNGDVAYSMQTAGLGEAQSKDKMGQRMTQAEFKDVADLVRKMLGTKVDAMFSSLPHAGEYHPMSETMVKGLIKVSTNALNPQGVAYHESLHAFFDLMGKDAATRDSLAVLTKAGNMPAMRDVFRDVFKDQPEVLKQIETNAEERAAYMFQLYAQGHAETIAALTAKPRSVLEQVKELIQRTLGIWTNHQRAAHIMDYFKDGKFAGETDMNAVSRALMEPGQVKWVSRLARDTQPLMNLVDAFATVGSARIADMNIGAFDQISRHIDAGTRGEGGDPGMIRTRRIEGSKMKNNFMADIGEATNAQLDAALGALRRGDLSKLAPEERLLAKTMTKHFDAAYDYMKKAGVDIGRLDFNKDYAPRVWDMNLIADGEPEFRKMLQKYVDSGHLPQSSVDSVINTLMGNEGGEIVVDSVTKPGNQFTKERILKFIDAADAEPFVNKNALETITRYMDQAAKRAEWSRRFGAVDEKGVIDENAKYTRMIDRAKKQGATAKEVETMERYVAGVNGTLGNDMSPQLRKLSSNVMIYQNLRLLPLGVFSAAIDANGIMVRGGSAHEAAGAFLRAIKEIKLNFQKSPDRDAAYKFAEDFGVIDNVAMNHALGGATFGMAHATPALRKANDMLFRFNGMEQWNTSMRVSGAQAAIGFIRAHGDGKATPHSARYLAELGLTAKDVIMGADGRPLTYKQQFIDHGMSDADATLASNKMGLAINRWVDGAILRPDATQKPIWFNDPHYAVFGHMKQFMYAFQETTLKRVLHEMDYGNYGPVAALATYIPVMLAADMAKGVLLGGGSLPAWQDDWGPLDFLERAFQRAGLLGVGQMGVDAVKSLHHGGYGVGAMFGPTANQAADVVKTVTGQREFGTTALDSMPAVNMASGVVREIANDAKVAQR